MAREWIKDTEKYEVETPFGTVDVQVVSERDVYVRCEKVIVNRVEYYGQFHVFHYEEGEFEDGRRYGTRTHERDGRSFETLEYFTRCEWLGTYNQSQMSHAAYTKFREAVVRIIVQWMQDNSEALRKGGLINVNNEMYRLEQKITEKEGEIADLRKQASDLLDKEGELSMEVTSEAVSS